MRKHIFNGFFYLICFIILFRSIYCLAFTIPPSPEAPGYNAYLYRTIIMSAGIGLMVVVPNLIIEFLAGNWTV